MEDAEFSDDFCRFLQGAVRGVDAAELLLLLQSQPERAWSAADAVAALRPSVTLGEQEAARYFADFQASGLVAPEPDGRVRYRPASETLGEQVRKLAIAYRERPVTLIRIIYALRDSGIRSFADAFRLKRN
jgi:hypothetical protein